MYKIRRNMKALSRTLTGKWKLMKTKTKKNIITGAFATVIGLTTLTGCGNQKDVSQPDTNIAQEQETTETPVAMQLDDDKEVEKNHAFLSDLLKLANVEMKSELDTLAEAEAYEVIDGITVGGIDEYGNPIGGSGETVEDVSYGDNVFVAPDGSLWSSEDEYNDYANGNTGKGDSSYMDFDGYVAPDGSLWDSKEEYDKYINGVDSNDTNKDKNDKDNETGKGDNSKNDGTYKAPDGTYWDSKEDYDTFINGGKENTDNFYTAPDGSLWDSEELYNEYIKSQNENADQPSDQPTEDEPIVEEGEGYKAPDGTYWNSKEEYEEYINSQNQNQEQTDNFYTAPDGSVWESEQDYNDYVNSMTETPAPDVQESTPTPEPEKEVQESTPTPEPEPEVQESTPEPEPEPEVQESTPAPEPEPEPAPQEDSYYTAPDGSVWVSQSDYDAYMSAEAENAKSM